MRLSFNSIIFLMAAVLLGGGCSSTRFVERTDTTWCYDTTYIKERVIDTLILVDLQKEIVREVYKLGDTAKASTTYSTAWAWQSDSNIVLKIWNNPNAEIRFQTVVHDTITKIVEGSKQTEYIEKVRVKTPWLPWLLFALLCAANVFWFAWRFFKR